MKLLMLVSLVALCALSASSAPYFFDDDGKVPEGLGKRAAEETFEDVMKAAMAGSDLISKREASNSAQPYKRSAFEPYGIFGDDVFTSPA